MNNNKFYRGQRVYYTGMTSYAEVTKEKATITDIKPSGYTLLLDYKYPSRDGIEIPKEQTAFADFNSLICGSKRMEPMY